MSPPVFVTVRDQQISGNEISPGSFSAVTLKGRGSAVIFLFFTAKRTDTGNCQCFFFVSCVTINMSGQKQKYFFVSEVIKDVYYIFMDLIRSLYFKPVCCEIDQMQNYCNKNVLSLSVLHKYNLKLYQLANLQHLFLFSEKQLRSK